MSQLPLNLEQTLRVLDELDMSEWSKLLASELPPLFEDGRNGNLPRWLGALAELPQLKLAHSVDLNSSQVRVGEADQLTEQERSTLAQSLQNLHPWRKGPFDIFGVDIDSEWRSDLKWGRLADKIQPLSGRMVLDVGCGNGYYALRMAGAGADLVVGVDPNLLFLCQFNAVTNYIPEHSVHFLPVGLESVPSKLHKFDTTFSMGVLYHRKSPFDHLEQLRGTLRSGGELILETLVIDGKKGEILVPAGRYAKMRNVWFIPSIAELVHWLERAGFKEVHCIDISDTRVEEQRVTEWMRFESLIDFLDPADQTLTIEGYPAPKRAVLSAIAL